VPFPVVIKPVIGLFGRIDQFFSLQAFNIAFLGGPKP